MVVVEKEMDLLYVFFFVVNYVKNMKYLNRKEDMEHVGQMMMVKVVIIVHVLVVDMDNVDDDDDDKNLVDVWDKDVYQKSVYDDDVNEDVWMLKENGQVEVGDFFDERGLSWSAQTSWALKRNENRME